MLLQDLRLKIEKCALGIIISIAPHFMCKVKPSDCGITKIRTLRQELGIMCHVFCDACVSKALASIKMGLHEINVVGDMGNDLGKE
jgi:hypothetical protein